MMAISTVSVLKKPKVVEEQHDSDSDSEEDSHTESEEEQEEEPGDVEIKEEVEDDCFDESYVDGESFTAYPTDEDAPEIKEEEEEEEESGDAISGNETDETRHKKKQTKSSKLPPEPDSDDSDDMGDDFGEGDSGDGDDEDDDGDSGGVESEKEGESEQSGVTGSGLANVMAKILGTKKSKDVILCKAKTDKQVKNSMKVTKEDTFEVVDSSGKVKTETKVDEVKEEKEEDEEEDEKPAIPQHHRELHRKLWEEKFRKRPNITQDREKEKKLRVMATQGVVQLFSAIEKHRAMLQVKLSRCRSIMGREKILESTSKEAFLDILKHQGKKVKSEGFGDEKVKKEEVKEEGEDEPMNLQPPLKKPKWNVLSDNFYKEPTLQSWDQQSDDEDD